MAAAAFGGMRKPDFDILAGGGVGQQRARDNALPSQTTVPIGRPGGSKPAIAGGDDLVARLQRRALRIKRVELGIGAVVAGHDGLCVARVRW